MTKFSNRDLRFSIGTGLITGFAAWQILEFLSANFFGIQAWSWLMVIMPIVFIVGTWLGYFLGQWMKFFDQFGKFAVIGITNAAVDFGVLNLLIAWTSHDSGWWYPGFKGISFLVAATASYFWNKYWAFNAGNTGTGGAEFGKFFTVAIGAFVINNLASSSVVNFVEPVLGLTGPQWANVGAVVGSIVATIVSFVGYKKFVFKK